MLRSRVSILVGSVVAVVLAGCSADDAPDPVASSMEEGLSSESTLPASTSLSAALSAAASTPVTKPVEVSYDVPYSSEFAFDVFYPEEPGGWAVAVVFHGGEESKGTMAEYATRVAEGGVVVFVPAFSSTPAQLADELHAGADDGACVMRYARTHAEDFGGSSDRVVAAGYSYGAVVAAQMALAGDRFGGDCVIGDDVTALADGFVGLDGLYDFATLPESLGFHDSYSLEEMQMASATTYIEAPARASTRFVLFTGSDAHSQEQAELFRAKLADVGYAVEMQARPDVSHSGFPLPAEGTVEALIDMASGS